MYISELHLYQFKNFNDKKLQFSQKINCFVGKNGAGKTNILDAIHYLSLTKSYLQHSDLANIQFGKDFFWIEGNFTNNTQDDLIKILVQQNQKKIIKKNNKSYEKLSEHIGKYISVIISPYDANLILEGSELRRKFLDGMISQLNINYLHQILQYNKILLQRNTLLKYFTANQTFEKEMLEVYDAQLIEFGNTIHQERKNFITDFIPKFKEYYQKISSENEEVSLEYQSQLNEDNLSELLKTNLPKDRISGFTQNGIHKDDIEFMIHQKPIKKFGSQGQQKTFLIALKLAQLSIFTEKTQQIPILLLDDIFDKLDQNRVKKLIELVNEEHFGQIFITDTDKHRTENLVKQIDENSLIIEL